MQSWQEYLRFVVTLTAVLDPFLAVPIFVSATAGYRARERQRLARIVTITVLLVLAGWTSLVYRIHAEERVLSGDAGWSAYAASVPYRLIPRVW